MFIRYLRAHCGWVFSNVAKILLLKSILISIISPSDPTPSFEKKSLGRNKKSSQVLTLFSLPLSLPLGVASHLKTKHGID